MASVDEEEVTARAPDSLHSGTNVAGYIIDGELGHGGMGVVYSAMHPVIGKRVAIKVLRPEVSTSQVTVERFIQEARAVNQIGHPNIVDIFAFGTHTDGRAYHVMDLLVGEPLRKRVKRGPLHASEAASVIDEIASALMAAHDHGFIHRDLKPDNIFLVTHDGRWPEVKLLDFGLAKLMPEGGVATFQTKAGVMLGTPEYMSPEQARGDPIDYRADIYALGILTFEILTGRRPFSTKGGAFAMLQMQIEEDPPRIAELVPGLPDELYQLVDAMLAKDREARPRLAAVRTVIKRLRSTQLPTMSVAGLEMAVRKPTIPPVVSEQDSGGRNTVRVGPGRRPSSPPVSSDPHTPSSVIELRNPVQRPSQPGIEPRAAMPAERPSQPAFQQPPVRPSQPGFQPPASQSQPMFQQPASQSQPMFQQPASQSQPMPRSPSAPPYASNPQQQRFISNHTPSPPSSAGLSKNQIHAQTTLGVPPPPLSIPSPMSSGTALVTAPPPPKTSWVWLVLGACAFIGAGIALALIVMR
jgi:eukaryotic-like serine/threonine-protein kinase